ncbi:MAG: lacto-N-biose phosphorylase central domain-containing protein [Blautia wexlerae]
MAVKTFGKGRGVYISGLPYSFKNSRVQLSCAAVPWVRHPRRGRISTAGGLCPIAQCRSYTLT